MEGIYSRGDAGIPEFARKRAASDGFEYTIEDAEETDLKHLIENSCMLCNRVLEKGAVKILPSSYIQEKDPYVRAGLVAKRYICAECYTKITSGTREKLRYSYRNAKDTIARKFLKNFIAID
ncbi:MAG: hypothetical protein ACP5K9_00935 [Candidatus Micrarchaeia archaeon]